MKRNDSKKGMGKQDSVAFCCSRCGACCRQLTVFGDMFLWLDGGDGVCRYFDRKSNLCSVYAIRPLICRVVEGHQLFFPYKKFSDYITTINSTCKVLRRMLNRKLMTGVS